MARDVTLEMTRNIDLLQFYVLRAVLSPSQKLYGVRQTSIMFREWHTSTRWTSWVQTSIML